MSKFKFIMAADPQYEWGPGLDVSTGMGTGGDWAKYVTVSKDNCPYYDDYEALARKQVESMNKLIAANPDIVGVMFNGDLVDYNEWQPAGQDMDLDMFKKIYGTISKPMYCGLGNHDYDNNVDDDGDHLPPSDMVDFLVENIKSNNVTNKDVIYTEGYNKAALCTNVTGSLAYSFDIYNVHFVQLNNYPGFTKNWESFLARYARTYVAKITDCYDWLEADLSKARKEGKAIIICQHQLWYDDVPAIDEIKEKYVELYNRYKVSAVFVGHNHKYFGKSSLSSLDCPVFFCGATSQCNYLLLDVDCDCNKITLQGVSSLLGDVTLFSEKENITLNTESGTTEAVTAPGYVTFFSEGGYTVKFTLEYSVDGTIHTEDTGKMRLGNKKTYQLPARATNYKVTCCAWNGSKFKSPFFTQTSDEPFNCTFRTYGALPNPKMEIIYD